MTSNTELKLIMNLIMNLIMLLIKRLLVEFYRDFYQGCGNVMFSVVSDCQSVQKQGEPVQKFSIVFLDQNQWNLYQQ